MTKLSTLTLLVLTTSLSSGFAEQREEPGLLAFRAAAGMLATVSAPELEDAPFEADPHYSNVPFDYNAAPSSVVAFGGVVCAGVVVLALTQVLAAAGVLLAANYLPDLLCPYSAQE